MCEVWLATKPCSTHHSFLEMLCTKPGRWKLFSYSSCLFVLNCPLDFGCAIVFLLFSCFPLKVDVLPSVFIFNPDLFSLYRFTTFEQRYTSVAFIFLNVSVPAPVTSIFYKKFCLNVWNNFTILYGIREIQEYWCQ